MSSPTGGAVPPYFRYRDKNGGDPVLDFLTRQVTKGELGQIENRMNVAIERGQPVNGDYRENLGGDLYVLRAPNTPNNPRIFMCHHPKHSRSYVLLHAYRKKTEKIPEAEMNTARKRQREVRDQPDKHIHIVGGQQ